MPYPYDDQTEYAPSEAYSQAPSPASAMGAAPSTMNRFARPLSGALNPNDTAYTRARAGQTGYGAGSTGTGSGDPYQPYYDPTNPNHQMDPGGSDLGANNGFNNANTWAQYQDQMGSLRRGTGERATAAAGSRATADAATQGRPTYGGAGPAPTYGGAGSYTEPTYQAPPAYRNDATRPPITNDWDTARSRYEQTGGGPVASRDATAGGVAGGGAAFRDYATGAGNMFLKDFNRNLRGQTDNAAGRGRLNTGFYDEDTGVLAQRMGSDFNDQLQMKALDAARMDQDAAVGNADRSYESSRDNADRALLASRDNTRRSEYLMDYSAEREDAAQGAYEDDRNFGRGNYEDDRNFGRTNYDTDRTFGRGVYGEDRDFGYTASRDNRGDYENSRDFEYGASRDANADWQDTRNFGEDRYRYDDAAAADTQNRYIDSITGASTWRTDASRYADSQKGSFGKALGSIAKVAAPIVGTLLAGPAGGAVGSALAGSGVKSAAANAAGTAAIGAGGFSGRFSSRFGK